MTRPFAWRYAALPSDHTSSRHRRRLSIERLEDIAAANSLQDLLLANFLGEAGAMAPTQSSIGGNLKSSERLVAAPQPIAALESRAPRSVPAPTESTTTVDPASSNPLLPASVAVNLADADLWLIGTSEPATPASHNPPASDSAGGSGGGASAGFAASSLTVASPAAFDPAGTPGGDTSTASPTIASTGHQTPAAPAAASPGDRASIRSALGGATIRLDGHGHRLENVFTGKPTALQARNVALPYGLVAFRVTNVQPGGIATVDLTVPAGAKFNGYAKQDPHTGVLSRFDFDGQTGAVVHGRTITLYLRDGGRGDDDGIVNGVVVDPGGPGDYGSYPVVVAAQVREVTFSGADLITIVADPGTPAYPSPPQWLDTDLNGVIDAAGDRSLPVGYPRNTDSVVSARFAATIQNSPNPPPPFYSLMVKGYNPMSAYQPYYYVVPPTTVLLEGTDLYLPPTTISNPFPGTVNYGTLGIIWSFSNDGGMNWSR